MDGAVNKRFLSTGETGELVRVNVEFDSNPGVVCATPQDLASNWKEGAVRKNLRNVGDAGRRRKNAAVNKTLPRSWGGDGMAPRHGFEPRFTAPKAAVLPLDDQGVRKVTSPIIIPVYAGLATIAK